MSYNLYLAYHEETKDEAQQRIWTFCEAIIIDFSTDTLYPIPGRHP